MDSTMDQNSQISNDKISPPTVNTNEISYSPRTTRNPSVGSSLNGLGGIGNGELTPAQSGETEQTKNYTHAEARQETSNIRNGSTAGIIEEQDDYADFFSPEIFQIILHNPTTAHRFLKFCQTRGCGENMEFLEKIKQYYRMLEDITRLMSDIYTNYTATDAPNQIKIPSQITKQISKDIKHSNRVILPVMEDIFLDAQDRIEKLLKSDIYPQFVKYQITASAAQALSDDTKRYAGLGDCFCLTDPARADNPIVCASDGFVSVTGYSRSDIIPRNCRFLQGVQTDRTAVRRLQRSIYYGEETVELLLNYSKNGQPFWNLLYCSPLYDCNGDVSFFLGGQINCSTTIHSCTDILKILSLNDEEDKEGILTAQNISRPQSLRSKSSSGRHSKSSSLNGKARNGFFKTFKRERKYDEEIMKMRDEAGMENELLERVGKMNFDTQVEAFYTAYSKYIVMSYSPVNGEMVVKHYSRGITDMLCTDIEGTIVPIYNKDIFRVLAQHTSSSASNTPSFFSTKKPGPGVLPKGFRSAIRDKLKVGDAVSVEVNLFTGVEEASGISASASLYKDEPREGKRFEERYVTHWTPLKDEIAKVKWVVLIIAPKF